MNGKYLSTGQAATRCSVSPDTVLKWIRSGRLLARRTAGGHHRIDEEDLERLLEDSSPSDRVPESHEHQRRFQYCWEYNGSGQLLDECKKCPVYLMRAHRCYEVAKLAPEVGPPRTFCVESCEDCGFYRMVQGQRTNVLVVTDDAELTRKLREAETGLLQPGDSRLRVHLFRNCQSFQTRLCHRRLFSGSSGQQGHRLPSPRRSQGPVRSCGAGRQ